MTRRRPGRCRVGLDVPGRHGDVESRIDRQVSGFSPVSDTVRLRQVLLVRSEGAFNARKIEALENIIRWSFSCTLPACTGHSS